MDSSNILHSEAMLSAADGTQLFTQSWRPAGAARAVVAIVHGLAEHSGRYQRVAAHLTSRGYAVEALDLRGHGRSAGPRSYVERFDRFVSDVDTMLQNAIVRNAALPLFLLGHSVGATVATTYTLANQPRLRGLLLSGGYLKVGVDVSPVLVAISGVLSALLPRFPALKIDSTLLSNDPAVGYAYDNDRLVYRGGVPARTGAELITAFKHIMAGAPALKLPMLIMHGAADGISDPAGSRQLYELAQSKDKLLKLYAGLKHEIMNEPEQAQVLADICDWLDAHSA